MLSLNGNWIDFIIIIVLIFFIHQGFVNGFWSILIDFISFFGSLLLSLRIYKVVANILIANFTLSRSIANALGFLIGAVLIEIILSFALSLLIKKLPQKILKNTIVKILGIILSFFQGIILIAFFITLIITLPINPNIKTAISDSKIGSLILEKTGRLEKQINSIFGGAINESLTYLTVEPQSHQSVPLDNKNDNLLIDRISESQMFLLVNKERESRGINALQFDVKLTVVGENYAKFMWQNHYFGHYDGQGHDVGDRLQKANISYMIAGENLALAPTVEVAHSGLMNSPGHRANILDRDFKKVGIGVVDNGFYGKMFVQVFTN